MNVISDIHLACIINGKYDVYISERRDNATGSPRSYRLPSKRVIEKCELTYEGTLRDYFYMNGEYVGRMYFSILRSEYEALRS